MSLFSKKSNRKISSSADNKKLIQVFQDFARHDFGNPFEELVRIKIKAEQIANILIKEHKHDK